MVTRISPVSKVQFTNVQLTITHPDLELLSVGETNIRRRNKYSVAIQIFGGDTNSRDRTAIRNISQQLLATMPTAPKNTTVLVELSR